MANGSALTLLLVIDGSWCLGDEGRAKRAKSRSQIPLSDKRSFGNFSLRNTLS